MVELLLITLSVAPWLASTVSSMNTLVPVAAMIALATIALILQNQSRN